MLDFWQEQDTSCLVGSQVTGDYDGKGLDCEVWCWLMVQDIILKIIEDLEKLLEHITQKGGEGGASLYPS